MRRPSFSTSGKHTSGKHRSLLAGALLWGAVALAPWSLMAKEPEDAPPKSDPPGTVNRGDDEKKEARDQAREERERERDKAREAREKERKDRDAARAEKPKPPATREDGAPTTDRPVRDAAQDVRDKARDTARDVRDRVRDSGEKAVDSARNTARNGQDIGRRAADAGREVGREARDLARDAAGKARDLGNQTGNTFRNRDVRSADLGLWLRRSTDKGLIIADVASQGAISRLGFHEGDVIVSVNGQKVVREADFTRFLLDRNIRSQRVAVIVLRDGAQETIWVEPTVLVTEYEHVDHDPLEKVGIILDDRQTDRLVVWRVVPRSPAFYAGVRAGDVIVSFSNTPVTVVADFTRLVRESDTGWIPMEIRRGDRTRQIEIDMPKMGATREERTVLRPNFDERRDDRQDIQEDRRELRDDRRDLREDRRDEVRPAPAPRTTDSNYYRRGLFGRRR